MPIVTVSSHPNFLNCCLFCVTAINTVLPVLSFSKQFIVLINISAYPYMKPLSFVCLLLLLLLLFLLLPLLDFTAVPLVVFYEEEL